MRPKTVDLAQVNRANDRILQQQAGIFQAGNGERAVRPDLDRKVEVAVSAVFPARDGAKHRKVTDSAPPKPRLRHRKLRRTTTIVLVGNLGASA